MLQVKDYLQSEANRRRVVSWGSGALMGVSVAAMAVLCKMRIQHGWKNSAFYSKELLAAHKIDLPRNLAWGAVLGALTWDLASRRLESHRWDAGISVFNGVAVFFLAHLCERLGVRYGMWGSLVAGIGWAWGSYLYLGHRHSQLHPKPLPVGESYRQQWVEHQRTHTSQRLLCDWWTPRRIGSNLFQKGGWQHRYTTSNGTRYGPLDYSGQILTWDPATLHFCKLGRTSVEFEAGAVYDRERRVVRGGGSRVKGRRGHQIVNIADGGRFALPDGGYRAFVSLNQDSITLHRNSNGQQLEIIPFHPSSGRPPIESHVRGNELLIAIYDEKNPKLIVLPLP